MRLEERVGSHDWGGTAAMPNTLSCIKFSLFVRFSPRNQSLSKTMRPARNGLLVHFYGKTFIPDHRSRHGDSRPTRDIKRIQADKRGKGTNSDGHIQVFVLSLTLWEHGACKIPSDGLHIGTAPNFVPAAASGRPGRLDGCLRSTIAAILPPEWPYWLDTSEPHSDGPRSARSRVGPVGCSRSGPGRGRWSRAVGRRQSSPAVSNREHLAPIATVPASGGASRPATGRRSCWRRPTTDGRRTGRPFRRRIRRCSDVRPRRRPAVGNRRRPGRFASTAGWPSAEHLWAAGRGTARGRPPPMNRACSRGRRFMLTEPRAKLDDMIDFQIESPSPINRNESTITSVPAWYQ